MVVWRTLQSLCVILCLLSSLLPMPGATAGVQAASASQGEASPYGTSLALAVAGRHFDVSAAATLPAWYRAATQRIEALQSQRDKRAQLASVASVAQVAPLAHSLLPAWYQTDVLPPPSAQVNGARHTVLPTSATLPAWYRTSGATAGAALPRFTILPSNVTVSGPKEIEPCQLVTYTIVVTNDGITATNVVLTSSMPAGFNPRERRYFVGELAPYGSRVFEDSFTAGCDAVSGQHTVTISQDNRDPFTVYTDFMVNPGAITLRILPNVIPARLGDVVTWTVMVQNTGYGTVSNVHVTDVLSSGLQFVGGYTEATYITIPVGAVVTFPLVARVVGCSGLEHEATATWGCGNTLCQTETAKASIDLLTDEPLLEFTPPDLQIDYCTNLGHFEMPVRNIGSGAAYTPFIGVDLSPLVITPTGGATYVTTPQPGFILPGPLPPGTMFSLEFDAGFPQACAGSDGAPLIYRPQYYDACGNRFEPPVHVGRWTRHGAVPSLSVSKAMPPEIQLGDVVTPTIVVDASNISGTLRVTDTVPLSWTVVSTDGAQVISVGNRIYLVWYNVPTGTTTFHPVLKSPQPDEGDNCAHCGTSMTNHVEVRATDCQNCDLYAEASASTRVQCDIGVAAAKEVAPASAETCSTYTYTNTYRFGSNIDTSWGRMVLTETLANAQQYVPGTLRAFVVSGTETYPLEAHAVTTVPQLVITFIDVATPVTGTTLIVRYDLQTTNRSASSCSDYTWYDWTIFDVGAETIGACGQDGILEEGVFVSSQAPQMAVRMERTPTGSVVNPCGVYTVTLNLERTSSVPAYDVQLHVPTSTYAILEVVGFGNVAPSQVVSDASGYRFDYADLFASTTAASVTLRMQLRCQANDGALAATLDYDDACHNNTTTDSTCQTGGVLDRPVVLRPSPIMYKFPEIIYASGDVVTWTLTAINSGSGTAYGVVLTDVLGSGLRYLSSSMTSTQRSAAGAPPPSILPNSVTWDNLVFLPGEKYVITYTAEIIGCADLTNRFFGTQGCLGEACLSGPQRVSRVVLPPTLLINTNVALTPLADCTTRTVTATVRNAGLLSVYSATVTETLPAGMVYVRGSTHYAIGWGSTPPNEDAWKAGSDPGGTPFGPLVWSTEQITNLAKLAPGETVWIRFAVRADCSFAGGNITIQAGYEDVCGQARRSQASSFAMPADPPRITARKQGRNLTTASEWGERVDATPGDRVQWQVTLANSSASAHAYNTVVTDVLPSNLTFNAASPPPSSVNDGVLVWNLGTLSANTTFTALITATVNDDGCTVLDATNTFTATWGCDEADVLCREQVSASASLRTRPLFGLPALSTEIPPHTLHQCGGVLTITLRNDGPPAHNVVLTDTLPSGYVYSDTITSSTPFSGVVDLGQSVVYTWNVLPSGVTTIALRVRNSSTGGDCAIPSGKNGIELQYDDAGGCVASGPYSISASVPISVIGPQLTVSKSPATLNAQVGQRITWTLRVTNTGLGIAHHPLVTDVVDTSFSSVTATSGSDGTLPTIFGNTITWTPQPIPAGGVWTAQVSAVPVSSGRNSDVVTVTAACDTGCRVTSASDEAHVTLMQEFDKAPALQDATIGSLVVFTFTLTLPDWDALYERLTITDTLPSGLGYVASVLTYTYDGDGSATTVISHTPTLMPGYLAHGDVVWRLGNLSGTVQVDGVLTAVIQNIASNQDGTRLTNTLRVRYVDEGRAYTYSDTANVHVWEPNLVLDKEVRSSTGSLINLNGTAFLTYTLTITNNGSWPAYDVLITDAVPSGLNVTALYGGDENSGPASRPITWTFASIAVGATRTVSYTARIQGAVPNITLTNRATATWTSTPDNPVGQERDGSGGVNDYVYTDSVSVRSANLVFSKTVQPGSTTSAPLRVGDVVTYMLRIQVPPGIFVPWPFLYDNLPAGVRYVSGTFQVTSTMPFTPPDPLAAAAVYDSRPDGVQGITSTVNPRVGRSEGSSAVETIEWWLDLLDNSASVVTSWVTTTFQAQLTGIDRNGAVLWTNPQALSTLNNVGYLYWNSFDYGSYNASFISQTLASTATSYVGQPLLHINKTYTTPGGCTALLLEDAFNRASTSPPTGWTAITGTWDIDATPGYARQSSGATDNAVLVRSEFSASDFSYSAMVQSVDSTSSRGLVFRYQDPTRYYRLRLRQGDGGNNIALEKISGTVSSLATAPITPAINLWYHIEVRAEGARLRVYLDGALLFDVVDSTPLLTGSLGFYANNCDANSCRFDDVFVTRLHDTSCLAGANDLITYTVTISNQGRTPAYDIVISDVLPIELAYVSSQLVSAPAGSMLTYQPTLGASGVITWGINVISGTSPSAFNYTNMRTLKLQVVARVTDTVGANTRFSNQVFLPYYDSQPGDGPTGTPIVSGTDADQRAYSDGSHSAGLRAVDGGIAKLVQFSPPPTATLGSLISYTLLVPASPISATLYDVLVTDTLDSRLRIEGVSVSGGSGWSYAWAGQVVTTTFAAITHNTQALITITARISHEWPNQDADANAGDVITDVARMRHATTPITYSNQVSTTVGEPAVQVHKTVGSSTGNLTNLDGTAELTYTIRLTNTGSSPAYSIVVTDAIPAGISVTALYGGDARSVPSAGPGVITWTVNVLDNAAPNNTLALTYTARVSAALIGSVLTNRVGVLYRSLTDTIPGVRPYTDTSAASVGTALPTLTKASEPFTLRVGDVVTYHLVFTVPAGTVGMGGSGSFLRDALPPGIWYITDSETLTWTPSTVEVTITQRVSNTTESPGYQVIRWYFAPITSAQEIPTVVTLTFRAQAVGLQIDNLFPVWGVQGAVYQPSNYLELWQDYNFITSATVLNRVVQPQLAIAKESLPSPDSYVGAGETVTYTLTITNDGYAPAYDTVLSDTLPAGLHYVTSSVSSSVPPTIHFIYEPTIDATGVLTWRVSELWGRDGNAGQPGVATVTVIARVSDTIGAHLTLTNYAAIPYYDSQPDVGPGPYTPTQREYADGSSSVWHRTVDASLAKAVTPPTATLGSLVTYTILVPTPPISATLYAVTVTDRVDDRLSIAEVVATGGQNPSAQWSGQYITVTFASIAHTTQGVITITAVLSDPLGARAGNVITDVAIMRHQDGGPTLSNETAFTVTEPALSLVKISNPPSGSQVLAGQQVTYTVSITNQEGENVSAAYDVVMTDTLPLGMRQTPPQIVKVVLEGSPLNQGSDYTFAYDSGSGLLTIALTPTRSIPPGGELHVSYVATVDGDVAAGSTLVNEASTIWSSLPGIVPGERGYGPITASTALTTPLATGLTKRVMPVAATVGSQIVYIITLPDPSVGATLYDVVVTDVVDARLRIEGIWAPDAQTAGYAEQVVTATYAQIPAYTQRVLVITATVRNQDDVRDGVEITDTARLNFRDNPSGELGSNVVATTIREPSLAPHKSVELPRDPLGGGDVVTYTLRFTNTGNWPAYDIRITDTLPSGITFLQTLALSVSDPSTATVTDTNTVGAEQLGWEVAQVNPGGEVLVVFTAWVSPAIGSGLTLTNTAEAQYDGLPGTPSDQERIYITPEVSASVRTGYPVLDLSKHAEPSPVSAGALLTYTLLVTNSGIVSATGVVVTESVPVRTRFVGCAPMPCGLVDATVAYTVGTIDVDATVAMNLVVRVDAGLRNGTLIANTAWMTSDEGLSDSDQVTTPVESGHRLTLFKDAEPSPVAAGGVLTYTLDWAVVGNEDAPGVVVTDRLPLNTVFQTCEPSPCELVGGEVVSWTLGDQPYNASGRLTLTLVVTHPLVSGTLISNVAWITDADGISQTAETVTPVEAWHQLQIDKTVHPAEVVPGDWLTYTLYYTISGNEPAFGVVVADEVPAHTGFWAADPQPYSAPEVGELGVVLWQLGDMLPAGSGEVERSGVLTLVVRVDSSLPNGLRIENAAVISDESGLRDEAVATSTVTSSYALQVDKEGGVTEARLGDRITYTIAYTVSGDEPVTPWIRDAVRPLFSFVTATGGISIEHPEPGQRGDVLWYLGPLTPTRAMPVTGEVTLVVQLSEPVTDGQSLPNTADIHDGLQVEKDTYTVTARAPVMHLSKEGIPEGVVAPGQIITYQLCYSNSGSVEATNVVITDIIPANTTYVSGSAQAGSGELEYYDGANWSGTEPAVVHGLRWRIPSVPATGETACVAFSVRVNALIMVGGRALWYTGDGWGVVVTPTPMPIPSAPPEPTVEPIPIEPTVEPLPVEAIEPADEPPPTEVIEPTVEPTAVESLESGMTVPLAQRAGLMIDLSLLDGIQLFDRSSWQGGPWPFLATSLVFNVLVDSVPAQMEPTPEAAPTPTPYADEEPQLELPAEPTEEPTPTPSAEPEVVETLEAETPVVPTAELPPTEEPTPTSSAEPDFTEMPTATPYAPTAEAPTPEVTETPVVTDTPVPEPIIPEIPTQVPEPEEPPAVTVLAVITTSIVNVAMLSSDQTIIVTDTHSNPLVSSVDPYVTKQGEPSQAYVGDEVIFTINVGNRGDGVATGVRVVDPLPVYLDVLEVTTTKGTVEISPPPPPQTVTVTIGQLAPSELVTIVIRTRVNENATPPMEMYNRAVLEFEQGLPVDSEVVIVRVVPYPTPTPTSTPAPPPEKKPKPKPRATPTPLPPPVQVVPTPTLPGLLPVERLPETGVQPEGDVAYGAWGFAGLIWAALLIGLAVGRRRRKG